MYLIQLASCNYCALISGKQWFDFQHGGCYWVYRSSVNPSTPLSRPPAFISKKGELHHGNVLLPLGVNVILPGAWEKALNEVTQNSSTVDTIASVYAPPIHAGLLETFYVWSGEKTGLSLIELMSLHFRVEKSNWISGFFPGAFSVLGKPATSWHDAPITP